MIIIKSRECKYNSERDILNVKIMATYDESIKRKGCIIKRSLHLHLLGFFQKKRKFKPLFFIQFNSLLCILNIIIMYKIKLMF